MTYFPLRQTTCFFIPLVAPCKPLLRKADFLLLCETMMELDFNNSLHKISCPTLLLYGEKDTANKNASIELAELLKNVELKTIIGAGHEVNIESPQELAEILHAFYERMS